jgi:hypothetical protein
MHVLPDDNTLVLMADSRETYKESRAHPGNAGLDLLGAKPRDVRAFSKQMLGFDRARELKEQMLAAALPV